MARNGIRSWWAAAAALGLPTGMSTLMEAAKPGRQEQPQALMEAEAPAKPPAPAPTRDLAGAPTLFAESGGPRQPPEGDGAAGAGRKSAAAAGENRCCLGALYFSQAMHDRKKGPVCLGVPSTPAGDAIDEAMKNPATGLADFKYLCVGYSMYSKPAATGSSKSNSLSDDIVQLPYCEGLEVVSSKDMQNSPVLLKEGMADGSMDSKPSDSQAGDSGSAEKVGPLGRNFVRPPTDVNLQEFPTRFMRSAKKIANKMKSNMQYMVKYIYKFYAGLLDGGGKPKGD